MDDDESEQGGNPHLQPCERSRYGDIDPVDGSEGGREMKCVSQNCSERLLVILPCVSRDTE
jgi:hypothetical protein